MVSEWLLFRVVLHRLFMDSDGDRWSSGVPTPSHAATSQVIAIKVPTNALRMLISIVNMEIVSFKLSSQKNPTRHRRNQKHICK